MARAQLMPAQSEVLDVLSQAFFRDDNQAMAGIQKLKGANANARK